MTVDTFTSQLPVWNCGGGGGDPDSAIMQVQIFKSCDKPSEDTLLLSIEPDDLDGATQQVIDIVTTYNDIISSTSSGVGTQTYASRVPDIKFSVNKSVEDAVYSELTSGIPFVNSTAFPGYKMQPIFDRAGEKVSSFYVVSNLFKTASSEEPYSRYVFPNCGFMSEGGMSFGGGKPIIKQFKLMPYIVGKDWSGWEGRRVVGGRGVNYRNDNAK